MRPAGFEDREAIAAIQAASPEGSSWDPSAYDVTVAELDGAVAGFLVTRIVAADEIEVLNVAVLPAFRRRGVAKALLSPLLERVRGQIFLEVRESNTPARQLYEAVGFSVVGRRREYYKNPCEAGIVMKFHSC